LKFSIRKKAQSLFATASFARARRGDMPPATVLAVNVPDAVGVRVSHLIKRPLANTHATTSGAPCDAALALLVPSPGEHFASRCAATVREDDANASVIYHASGKYVFATSVTFETASNGDDDAEVKRGKEGSLQPRATPATTRNAQTTVVGEMFTGREIQSLYVARNSSSLIQAVDDVGSVTYWSRGFDADTANVEHAQVHTRPGFDYCTPGWSGALVSDDGKQSFIVQRANRWISWVDMETGRAIRRMCTFLPPFDAKMIFDSDDRVLAIAEGHQLAMYDVRVNEKGGCVSRISLGYNKNVYAVATSRGPGLEHIVACGGEERVVHVIDVRTLGAAERWRNALKYDITMLEMSETSKGFVYVAGLDCECVCGNWRAQSAEDGFAFRADSRWMGLTALPAFDDRSDILAGWSESGHIYAARTYPKL